MIIVLAVVKLISILLALVESIMIKGNLFRSLFYLKPINSILFLITSYTLINSFMFNNNNIKIIKLIYTIPKRKPLNLEGTSPRLIW